MPTGRDLLLAELAGRVLLLEQRLDQTQARAEAVERWLNQTATVVDSLTLGHVELLDGVRELQAELHGELLDPEPRRWRTH